MGQIPKQHVARLIAMERRAQTIAEAGGLEAALAGGTLPNPIDTTLAEGLVLGLLKQGVRKYLAVFGHGSTDLAEVLRVYEAAGLTRTYNFRHETAMAHAATALKWHYGETAAVVTSIGPGALHAFAGSLAAASNGIGVYHIYGDETTHGEGPNMQAIPKHAQGLFGQLTALMGESYVLHTPEALRAALRRGSLAVHRSFRAGPFFLLLPLNTQPARIARLNLEALPGPLAPPPMAVGDPAIVAAALGLIQTHRRIVVKVGGGARAFARQVRALVEAIGAVAVLSPGALGVVPDEHPRNMGVMGSKGTLSGNYATSHADLLIVIGSRGVCQADCSGTGYASASAVININADLGDVTHYNRTVALAGDIGVVIGQLRETLQKQGGVDLGRAEAWLDATAAKKREWQALKAERYAHPVLRDPDVGAARPDAARSDQDRLRLRQQHSRREVLRRRRCAGGRIPGGGGRRAEPDDHGDRGFAHGVCGERTPRVGRGGPAAVRGRFQRGRVVLHESAGPGGRRPARRPRDDPPAGQSSDGGHLGLAGGAVRRGVPDA